MCFQVDDNMETGFEVNLIDRSHKDSVFVLTLKVPSLRRSLLSNIDVCFEYVRGGRRRSPNVGMNDLGAGRPFKPSKCSWIFFGV